MWSVIIIKNATYGNDQEIGVCYYLHVPYPLYIESHPLTLCAVVRADSINNTPDVIKDLCM